MTGELGGVSGYAVDLVLGGLPFSWVVVVPTRTLQLGECGSSQVSEEEPLAGGCLDWEPRHWRHTCGHSSSKKRGTGAAPRERRTALQPGDTGHCGRERLELRGWRSSEAISEERSARRYGEVKERAGRTASQRSYESCLSEWHL